MLCTNKPIICVFSKFLFCFLAGECFASSWFVYYLVVANVEQLSFQILSAKVSEVLTLTWIFFIVESSVKDSGNTAM